MCNSMRLKSWAWFPISPFDSQLVPISRVTGVPYFSVSHLWPANALLHVKNFLTQNICGARARSSDAFLVPTNPLFRVKKIWHKKLWSAGAQFGRISCAYKSTVLCKNFFYWNSALPSKVFGNLVLGKGSDANGSHQGGTAFSTTVCCKAWVQQGTGKKVLRKTPLFFQGGCRMAWVCTRQNPSK